MEEIFTLPAMIALAQVIMVDLLLAVDNTIIVGLVAASVPPEYRKRVIFFGIAFATVLRIGFAVIASFLLSIVGLMMAGGLLLLWVGWKMFREIYKKPPILAAVATQKQTPKTFKQAVVQVVLADVAMSLDNVLAVAGAAQEHIWVLIFGLLLSVFLMGAASTTLANMMEKRRWLVYVGIGVVFVVAMEMIIKGFMQFM
jgi:YjbE family integral membrane protein